MRDFVWARSIAAAIPCAACGVMNTIVVKMAALTHCSQIVRVAVLRDMIEMRDSQYHSGGSVISRFAVPVQAAAIGMQVPSVPPALTNALAPPSSPFGTDFQGDGFPVRWIPTSVLRTDRHEKTTHSRLASGACGAPLKILLHLSNPLNCLTDMPRHSDAGPLGAEISVLVCRELRDKFVPVTNDCRPL